MKLIADICYSFPDVCNTIADVCNCMQYRDISILLLISQGIRWRWRLICCWLGVVCAWSTQATVGSGGGWLGVVVAVAGWAQRVGAPPLGTF